MENNCEDIYFLNIEDAFLEAAKQNKIVNESGDQRFQFCYYDGPLTDITLQNFIQISMDDLIDKLANSWLPIPTKIAIRNDSGLVLNDMPSDIFTEISDKRRERLNIINEILWHADSEKLSELFDRDTYYLDPLEALNQAKYQARVYCGHPTIDGLQVCFYRGDLPANTIKNLVKVEPKNIVEFFASTTYRIPGKVKESATVSIDQQLLVTDVESLLALAKKMRYEIGAQLFESCKGLKPEIDIHRPLRVFIPTCRLTTVMQYCSKNVAKEFERRGFEVLLHIEEDDMHGINVAERLRQYIAFNPHIAFYVNGGSDPFQSSSVINVTWWQDLMPKLQSGKPLQVRENDYMFSFSKVLDVYLERCNVKRIVRQCFAIDESIFYDDENDNRENKVVFIGSSHLINIDLTDPEIQRIASIIKARIENGEVVSKEDVVEIAKETSLSGEYIFWKILHYVVRDYSVKWICQISPLPVTVYGRYWERDPAVAENFAGELAHGIAVADVYRSVKYALVSHPFEINSQRLVEVAACGCIPIVYDCREVAEQPHWEEYCLFFKTKEDLKSILETQAIPLRDPKEMAARFSYRAAVDNFIANSGIKDLMNAHQIKAQEVKASVVDKTNDAPRAHLYFTDLNRALIQAGKSKIIDDNVGGHYLQYCYYDGDLSNITCKNLIRVRQSEFTEFFVYNELPIPTWIINQNGDRWDLTKDPGMIEQIQNLRNNKKNPISHPDSDFFDALEALNTAKQQNSHIDQYGNIGKQICYYHGEKIEAGLDNLIHVDINNIYDFFITTRFRLPEVLRADPSLKADYENVFSAVFEQKQHVVELLKQEAILLAPSFSATKSIKVLIIASNAKSEILRLENEIMNSSWYCDIYIENGELEDFNLIDFLYKYIEYQPHILIQENHLYNDFLHEDVINVIYWSNVNVLTGESELGLRRNDFNIGSSDIICQHLRRCSASDVHLTTDISVNDLYLGLWSSIAEDLKTFAVKHPDYSLRINSRDSELLDEGVDCFSKNMCFLAEKKLDVYDAVSELLNNHDVEINIDYKIGGVVYSAVVRVDGERISVNQEKLKNNIETIAKFAAKVNGENFYSCCIVGLGLGYELIRMVSTTAMPVQELANVEIPIMIVDSDPSALIAAMIVNDLREVMALKRIAFYLGDIGLEKFESDLRLTSSVIPDLFIQAGNSDHWFQSVFELIQGLEGERRIRHQQNLVEIATHYGAVSRSQWQEKFRETNRRQLKVLALSSVFTSFLQYCIRDLMEGFKNIGAEVHICIEQENHQRVGIEKVIGDINCYKPDLVIVIDHFRHEYQGMPESLPFVNWIQDMLPNIVNNKKPTSFLDFTFVFAKRWLTFNDIDIYKKYKFEFLPLGYSDKYYYPLNNDFYCCDILFVSHLQDPSSTLEPFRKNSAVELCFNANEARILDQGLISVEKLQKIYEILTDFCSDISMAEFHNYCVQHEGQNHDEFYNFHVSSLKKLFNEHGVDIDSSIYDILLPVTGNRLHYEYLNRMKMTPIDVLLSAFSDIEIHLYGKNWQKYNRFFPYAKGEAENGIFLNKIMNNAKICLNCSPGITLHMRALEIIASGVFMMTRRILHDGSPISDFFSDDEVVLFDDEQDLVKKTEFYLRHKSARKSFSAKALNTLKQKLSYKGVAENILLSIQKRLSEDVVN